MSFRIFAHGVGDGSVTLAKKDNTEKLITKHRKAAKMIGDLLEQLTTISDALNQIGIESEKYKRACKDYANERAGVEFENARLRIDRDKLGRENYQLKGEIRALERTVDKMIGARK